MPFGPKTICLLLFVGVKDLGQSNSIGINFDKYTNFIEGQPKYTRSILRDSQKETSKSTKINQL
jgi:hypothetical protein